MTDDSLLDRIERLIHEEHQLQHREQDDAKDDAALGADRERLQAIKVDLDQCWDLLRQRRARRAAGADPDGAQVRDAAVVESYRQ